MSTITPEQKLAMTNHQQSGLHWLLRAVYFIVIGLPLSSLWAAIAWVISITVIGLPLGLWMLSRLPQVTTLQPMRQDITINRYGEVYHSAVPQHNFLLRALYFIVVGWWFSGIWLAAAWALSSSIIGLPIAFLMINYVPAVMTLQRN